MCPNMELISDLLVNAQPLRHTGWAKTCTLINVTHKTASTPCHPSQEQIRCFMDHPQTCHTLTSSSLRPSPFPETLPSFAPAHFALQSLTVAYSVTSNPLISWSFHFPICKVWRITFLHWAMMRIRLDEISRCLIHTKQSLKC